MSRGAKRRWLEAAEGARKTCLNLDEFDALIAAHQAQYVDECIEGLLSNEFKPFYEPSTR